MAFRIPNNVAALNVNRWLSTAQTNLEKSLERLSSGYRINSAADDAAGLAISNEFRLQISSLKVAYNNADQAINMVQVAEGSMNQIVSMINRLKELATEAASDTVDDARRAYLDDEAQEILNEINKIADSTEYAGQVLFNGGATSTTFTIQVGYENADSNRIEVSITDVHTSHLGAGGLDGLDISSLSGAQSALTSIDNALSSVNSALAGLGAVQNKLTYAKEQIQVMIENFTASESTIRDVDMASEMSNFTKNQILVQTSMAMLAQANALPQSIVQLLR